MLDSVVGRLELVLSILISAFLILPYLIPVLSFHYRAYSEPPFIPANGLVHASSV